MDRKTTQEDLDTLSIDNVLSVYTGKKHACRCGCSGKHRYNSLFREESGKRLGYPIEDSEINDRTVKMIMNRIKKSNPENVELIDGLNAKEKILTIENGNRWNIVYSKVQK